MKHWRRIDLKAAQAIVNDYRTNPNRTVRNIGADYGVGRSTVSRILSGKGRFAALTFPGDWENFKRHRRSTSYLTVSDLMAIRDEVADGYRWAQVCERWGIDDSSLRAILSGRYVARLDGDV